MKKIEEFKSTYDREQSIIKMWEDGKIFEKSIKDRPADDLYNFYDGPPFVSGLPHYGHILGRIAKDLYPRFWTMRGKRVRRVWGWDCHGLPVEDKTGQKLGLKNRREIETFGAYPFINECKTYVQQTSAQWKWYVDRVGEWIDMDNPYRTMDLTYMESVIWAFKQLYDKKYVYKGRKTLLYCPKCGTPISKFEIAMDNSYRDLEDPAVMPKFKLKYHKTGLGVGCVTENEKGEILMMMRNEPGREKIWGLWGGKMDPEDKTLEDTVRREAKEELGVNVEIKEYYSNHIDLFEGRLFNTYHFGVKLLGDPKLSDTNVGTELRWFKKTELPWDSMHIPTRNTLKDYLENKPLSQSPRVSKPDVYLLAWTTTPWTLPSNKALVVDKNAVYVCAVVDNEYVIYAKARQKYVMKDKKFKIYDEFQGKELVGLSYEPLYEYFEHNENDMRVYDYEGMVNMEEGTGIVHSAPGYGEIDTEMGNSYGLSTSDALDDAGNFIDKVEKWKGVFVKKADEMIIEDLKQSNKLFMTEKIVHSYPVCYRCATPLLYRSVIGWFIKIQDFKEKMLEHNKKVNWYPANMSKRFVNNVKDAPDWCISRTRYWATAMPLWHCEKCDKYKVAGSIKEIEENSIEKVKVEDLHRTGLDHIKFRCECGGEMQRIPEVLDCWFESGSMPYAQLHYPFENVKEFETSFPADFIIEYVAQIRAWFFCMHVLSTLLFDKPCYKNSLVTGVMAGTDGRKMSKTFHNYPDPKDVIEKYGGDAMRYALMGSPMIYGENSDATIIEKGSDEYIKKVNITLLNSVRFLMLYAQQHKWVHNDKYNAEEKSVNILDKWILSVVNTYTKQTEAYLLKYNTPAAVKLIAPFVDSLSTWYIRRSRNRFADGDRNVMEVLWCVLLQFAKTVAPILPFLAEIIYQALEPNDVESVHLSKWPEYGKIDKSILDSMDLTRRVVSLGQAARVACGIKVKQPLAKLLVDGAELQGEYKQIAEDELNIKDILAGEIDKNLFEQGDSSVKTDGEIFVRLDTNLTDELREEGFIRQFTREIQQARKQSGLNMGDEIEMKVFTDSKLCRQIIEKNKELVMRSVKAVNLSLEKSAEMKTLTIDDTIVEVEIKKIE